MTGPVEAFAPVPLPAAAWLLLLYNSRVARRAINHSAATYRFIVGCFLSEVEQILDVAKQRA